MRHHRNHEGGKSGEDPGVENHLENTGNESISREAQRSKRQHEMAGVVSEIGKGVTAFHPGDRVVVLNSAPCNHCYYCELGSTELCEHLELLNGAYGEYIRVPPQIVQQNVYRVPEKLDFAEAALTEPLACALHAPERRSDLYRNGQPDLWSNHWSVFTHEREGNEDQEHSIW